MREFPMARCLIPAAVAASLAQPTALVFDPTGRTSLCRRVRSDRIGVLDANGTVLNRSRSPRRRPAHPSRKRGPRGLALHPGEVVMCRTASRIRFRLVDTITNSDCGRNSRGLFDPTSSGDSPGPRISLRRPVVRQWLVRAPACHVDADMDFLTWDLGDPAATCRS